MAQICSSINGFRHSNKNPILCEVSRFPKGATQILLSISWLFPKSFLTLSWLFPKSFLPLYGYFPDSFLTLIWLLFKSSWLFPDSFLTFFILSWLFSGSFLTLSWICHWFFLTQFWLFHCFFLTIFWFSLSLSWLFPGSFFIEYFLNLSCLFPDTSLPLSWFFHGFS